jgi:hypothetical protein
MSEVLVIKQVPDDLKKFWAEEAKQNARSIDHEIISVLEDERARRELAPPERKNMAEILEAARRLQSFKVLDDRSLEDILYDDEGMPK